jgi:hypothetical protein
MGLFRLEVEMNCDSCGANIGLLREVVLGPIRHLCPSCEGKVRVKVQELAENVRRHGVDAVGFVVRRHGDHSERS